MWRTPVASLPGWMAGSGSSTKNLARGAQQQRAAAAPESAGDLRDERRGIA